MSTALAPPAKKSRRGADAIDEVMARAARLDLLGPLGVSHLPGSPFEAALLDAHRRACFAAMNIPLITSALTWLEGFELARQRDGESTPLFVPAIGPHREEGAIYNRMKLDAFMQFVRQSPPLRGGAERVAAETIASYVAQIRLLRSREARYDVAPLDEDMLSDLALKNYRQMDPLKGERRLKRAIRISMFAEAADAGFDRFSEQGIIDWAAGLTAHNTYSRGGEIGEQDNPRPQDAKRVVKFESLQWQPRHDAGKRRPWLMYILVPIKDTSGKHRGYPTPIVRRHDGVFGSDPLCTYDALAAAWWSRRGPQGMALPLDECGAPAEGWWRLEAPTHPPGRGDTDPFFTRFGATWRTTDTRNLAQRLVAHRSDIPPNEVGASAFRSGGATDTRARRGEAGQSLIKQRGRWASDIGEIYTRHILDEHLQLSEDISIAGGCDLEAVCAGRWAQPARR